VLARRVDTSAKLTFLLAMGLAELGSFGPFDEPAKEDAEVEIVRLRPSSRSKRQWKFSDHLFTQTKEY
jgi:hypothetical protein